MKNRILILITGILGVFWSCKDDFKVNYPKEEFGVIKGQYSDGSIAIGIFNRGYKNYGEKSEYPWSLKITLNLNSKKCYPNGLPLGDEKEIANQIEKKLVNNISKISPTQNIGHLFYKNHLDIYLYVRDKTKADELLHVESKKEKLIRSFSYELVEDKNWELVEEFMHDK